MTDDLVQRLTAAATEAIANERTALEYDPARLRGIVLELTIGRGGRTVEGVCFVERKAKVERE